MALDLSGPAFAKHSSEAESNDPVPLKLGPCLLVK
jgi:hypothetical protein